MLLAGGIPLGDYLRGAYSGFQKSQDYKIGTHNKEKSDVKTGRLEEDQETKIFWQHTQNQS